MSVDDRQHTTHDALRCEWRQRPCMFGFSATLIHDGTENAQDASVALRGFWSRSGDLDHAQSGKGRLCVEQPKRRDQAAPNAVYPLAFTLIHGKRPLDKPLDSAFECRDQARFEISERLIERATRDSGAFAYSTDARSLQAILRHCLDKRKQ